MGRFGPKPGPKKRKPFGIRAIVAPDEPGSHSGAPSCPANLTEPQKTCFRTVVRELSETPGLLQRADRACLTQFATHFSNWKIAQKHRDLEGDVLDVRDRNGQVIGQKLSEFVHISQKEAEIVMKLGDRLSLNPSARETLHVPSPPPQGLPDPLMPPRRLSLERTISVTETLAQEPDLSLFDSLVEVQPDPVDQDKIVPVVEPEPIVPVESPAAAVESPAAELEPVVEPEEVAPVKKTERPWPFPDFRD